MDGKKHVKWFTIGLMVVLFGCAEEPEDPGLCRLSCGKARIGPIEAEIRAVQITQDLVCPVAAALQPLSEPLMFQFVVSETIDGTLIGEDHVVPLSNVSFDPIVIGFRSGLPEHNPNVTIEGDVYTPSRYKGIVTPSDNWCSDACGVATVEIVPVCPPPGESSEIGVQIHSGALYSESYEVTISTADDEG